jgi:hypothetical protein
MMPSMRSSHQEDDTNTINNIKAPQTTRLSRSTITNSRHDNKPHTVIRKLPNYKNTILNKNKAMTRLQQYNHATKQLYDKLQQRNQQRQHYLLSSQTDKWVGDEMNFHDEWNNGEYTTTMRICTININGISQDLDWIEWDMTLRSMQNLQIDVLGITEPNINFKNQYVTNKLLDTSKAFEGNTQISMSCSNQLNTTRKKKAVQ